MLNPTEAIEYDDLDLGLLDTTKKTTTAIQDHRSERKTMLHHPLKT
ncbi:MAG: hypothetical protein ACO20Y_04910 [Poseidonia sp.]